MVAAHRRGVQIDRRYPAEIILSVIEARLDQHRPADALGIPDNASVDHACTVYSQLVRELARFHGHPALGARAILAARRSRYALFAFIKLARARVIDSQLPVGMTRSR